MTDAGPEYTIVDGVDGSLAGGIMQTREGMPPYVTIYVRVDDLDAALSEIGHLGGRTVVPPTEINESMTFALFADPEGNTVGLLRQVPATG